MAGAGPLDEPCSITRPPDESPAGVASLTIGPSGSWWALVTASAAAPALLSPPSFPT
jgi:hypothetical protein